MQQLHNILIVIFSDFIFAQDMLLIWILKMCHYTL